MASNTDTYSDLEMSDDDEEDIGELNKLFNAAKEYVIALASHLSVDTKLQLYGLYKQATEGPCNIPKPSFYELKAKQKWTAWNALEDLPSETAKDRYVKLVQEVDPTWGDSKVKKETVRGPRVVLPERPKIESENLEKSVFDMCKEGNIEEVVRNLEKDPKIINNLDYGLGLIHWAVDRDQTEILKILLQHNCDVSMRDSNGQTALHYATSCGHAECVEILLGYGADKSLEDEDGFTPLDCASDDVKHLL